VGDTISSSSIRRKKLYGENCLAEQVAGVGHPFSNGFLLVVVSNLLFQTNASCFLLVSADALQEQHPPLLSTSLTSCLTWGNVFSWRFAHRSLSQHLEQSRTLDSRAILVSYTLGHTKPRRNYSYYWKRSYQRQQLVS